MKKYRCLECDSQFEGYKGMIETNPICLDCISENRNNIDFLDSAIVGGIQNDEVLGGEALRKIVQRKFGNIDDDDIDDEDCNFDDNDDYDYGRY